MTLPLHRIGRIAALAAAALTSLPGTSDRLRAQTRSDTGASVDSVTVMPGARYAATGLKSFMAGKAYRDLWTTPIKVEVADLATLGGGLTPVRVGGGAQTKVLHVQGADGKRYVFRSVEKFAAQGIPDMVRGTPYESVLQDQVSSLHPTAALVVAPLLRAVNVLHVEPRLVVVPDDPRLGEFRQGFAGMLALFEERPDEGPDDGPGFAGSTRIVGSQRLFELIEQDPRNKVDATALLAARLVDILLGDRDRSVDNWWWARFDAPEGYNWRPIPRDRDQAFIRSEGFLKHLLRFYEPELAAAGEGYSSSGIVGLTRSGWDLDRRFLVGVERTSWDSVVHELQAGLTDSVIDAAVRQMPPRHVELVGERLTRRLKERRDDLPKAADRFYEIVTRYAEVHGTDGPDYAIVTRTPEGDVEVALYRGTGETGPTGTIPYFDRRFRYKETHEIRLYLRGGADHAVVLGRAPESITVRVIGGEGPDRLVDSSRVGEVETLLYDAGPDTRFVPGPSTRTSRRRATPPAAWRDDAPQHPDWGTRWAQAPLISMGGDLGLYVAATATLTRYGFLKDPYSSRTRFRAGYASGPPGFLLEVRQDFRDARPYVHPVVLARLSEIEVVNFFGFGNETEIRFSRDFHKLQQKQLLLAPSVTFSNGGPFSVNVGPILKRSNSDTTPRAPNYLSQTQPYGSGPFLQFGGQVEFTVDTRNRRAAPSSGILLSGGGSVYPRLFDVDRDVFGELHGELSTYLSPSASGDQTLAIRVGAKKVFGPVPFHEAAFIGGRDNLRGFHEERYGGEAAVYGNAELRLFVTRFSFLVPSEFGLFGLADVGRVFIDGEQSSTWHTGVGGGIWIAPFRRVNTLTAAVAFGQRTRFYFGSGFMF